MPFVNEMNRQFCKNSMRSFKMRWKRIEKSCEIHKVFRSFIRENTVV